MYNERLRLYPQHQLSRPELWIEGHAVDNASHVYRRPVSQRQAKGRGLGATMSARHTFSASKSQFRCFNCDKPGHRKSECPHLKNEASVPAAEGSAKTKWCSKQRSTTHGDAECRTKNKWCSKHRLTHNDAECKGQRNKRNETNAKVAI